MRSMYFSIFLGALCSFSCFDVHFLSAECKKCAQIEAERETEKSQKPQPQSEYYEDRLKSDQQLSLNNSINLQSIPNQQRSTNIDMPNAGVLEGSRYYSQELESKRTDDNKDPLKSFSIISFILESKDINKIFKEPFTLFIPSNEALQKLPPHAIQAVFNLENREKVLNFIKTHVVAKKITKADFGNEYTKNYNLNNQPLVLKDNEGILTVNKIRVLRSEELGNNGTIYIIDRLLTP